MQRRPFLTTMSSLPFLPSLLAAAPEMQQRDRALIILWMDGGMSHLDTFDGKPEAPTAIRGDLGHVESALEGVFVSEPLADLGKMMDRFTLVRSLTSPEGNHDRGSHYMLTGRRPTPVLTYPSYGSLLDHGAMSDTPIPPYVAIPDAHPYGKEGFLPVSRGPFELGAAPGKSDFKVRDLQPPVPMERAMKLLQALDAIDGAPRSASEAARDQFLAQARHLSLDPAVRSLFKVSEEAPSAHKLYGRHFLGQSCLLARRLIEGGVRTVLVRDRGWDHHQGIARALTYGFPPKLEMINQAVPALYQDLAERGLLERTTVLLASEFGRTPRLNPAGGRDHWSRASSALLFGAGLKPGTVVGKTDARGEEPAERAVSPADLFMTVLAALGFDTDKNLTTPDKRPVRVVDEEAFPIKEMLAT
ncbi:MAG: hypothetical protein ACI9R3_004848 [Verrucomicrobiales bacterium]|jgi:hypothetical protein